MRTKMAGLDDALMVLAAMFNQLFEYHLRPRRCGGGGKSRTHARAGIGSQGELADQQQPALDIGKRAIHPPATVGKHPVAQKARTHAFNLCRPIFWFHPDQGDKAGADLTNNVLFNTDAGVGDALDQGKHARFPVVWGSGWARLPVKLVSMHRLMARLLYLLLALFCRLPQRWLYRMGDGLAWSWRWIGARESKVALRNLELALPEHPPASRAQLHIAILHATARQTLETFRLWTRPSADTLSWIVEHHGVAEFQRALASSTGVIIAAPHMGNWELLNRWLAAQTPLAILYRPPESRIGEAFLRLVRADATRVSQIRADAAGVRALFKRLREGGVVGILPDQQPKVGDGAFAPFFGLEALTMTLLSRLAERSGAQVIFAWCERIGEGPQYALHLEPANPAIASPDPASALTALNAQIEQIARRDLAQYQWTYKRFKARPEGSGEDSPYADFER